jgi:hypothetical protein
MNRLHLILAAALDAAKEGGLSQKHAEAVFNALSDYLTGVPSDSVSLFEGNVRKILDAPLPPESTPVILKAPFILPPDFLASFGYRRGRRLVALYWEPCGDEACYDDGVSSACGRATAGSTSISSAGPTCGAGSTRKASTWAAPASRHGTGWSWTHRPGRSTPPLAPRPGCSSGSRGSPARATADPDVTPGGS